METNRARLFMKDISSLSFDIEGWKSVHQTTNLIQWRRDDNTDLLSLHFFELPPDIPFSLSDVKQLRDAYRHAVSQAGGGLISVEVIALKGLPALGCLFKFPQEPHGMTYVGSFTLPFQDCSFVIKAQCQQEGITGTRESAVMDIYLRDLPEQNRELIATGKLRGWARDPYDPTFEGPALRNLAEDPAHDERFPDHPLSRLRHYMRHIKDTIKLNPELFSLAPFQA